VSGIVRTLLIRGMLAGLVAGFAAFTFATVVGEPWVREAIAYEDATGASEAHHDVGGTVVSRTVQSTAGLLTGTAVAGIALGGLFALVYAFALGRVGPRSPRPLAVALMAAALVSVAVVPFFKYPANPPGVGDPDTVGRRTVLYLALIAVALAGAALAVAARRRLLGSRDSFTATTFAGILWLALIALTYVVLPDGPRAPIGFPADVLWGFRVASLGVQAVLWSTIGLVFAASVERVFAAAPSDTRLSSLTG
jgi:Probable cobalt transporter subunit (CbtA)